MTERRRTSTSNFGVGARESHDSTGFYERFRPPVVSTDEIVVQPRELVDPFFCGDARHMDGIEDGSVGLVVTSPPYFAGKTYEEELEREGVPATYLEYLNMLRDVFSECVRKLEPGGRIAVNVANLGRKPYRSLSSDVIQILERDLGLLLRGELIWQKGEGASGSCAWGSFRSASNPVLRDLTERVIVASKGRFDRAKSVKQRTIEGLPYESTLTTEDFMALTLDVWSIHPESAHRVGHPAPFPVELPEQLIRLYTFKGDLVVDPFMGSGSTLVAAAKLGRRFAGYDLDPSYVEIARQRVDGIVQVEELEPGESTPKDDDFVDRVVKEGRAVQHLAREVLEHAGFRIIGTNKRIPKTGVAVNFVALDDDDRRWFFNIAGTFTNYRGGLIQTDVVWKALGRASALRGREKDVPIIFLTTHLPKQPGEGDTALRAAGPDALFDVIDMLSNQALERLERYAKGGFTNNPQPGFWNPADLFRQSPPL